MPHRILVTRRVFPQALELLGAHGEVDYHDPGPPPGRLADHIAGAHALVCQLTDPITADVLRAGAGTLRIVANVAVGHDNVDLVTARELGIAVTNTPDVLTESTADLTFALLLAAARRLPESERYLRAGRWQGFTLDLLCGHDVHGAALGIVGMGRIGRAVARRARGFAMRVLYHAQRPLAPQLEAELGVQRASLDDLLRQADFVTLHVPLRADTARLIGRRELHLMQPSAFLVNTSRGGVVDEEALVEALATRRIAGAALDVFTSEPHVPAALLALDNVVLTPHVGSATRATRAGMALLAARNVVAVLQGRAPLTPVGAGT